jgi:hypothetical protein
MASKPYTLVVQNHAEERQIRRLGAAVSLLWEELPAGVRDQLLQQASEVHISGQTALAEDLREQILTFLETRAIRSPDG